MRGGRESAGAHLADTGGMWYTESRHEAREFSTAVETPVETPVPKPRNGNRGEGRRAEAVSYPQRRLASRNLATVVDFFAVILAVLPPLVAWS